MEQKEKFINIQLFADAEPPTDTEESSDYEVLEQDDDDGDYADDWGDDEDSDDDWGEDSDSDDNGDNSGEREVDDEKSVKGVDETDDTQSKGNAKTLDIEAMQRAAYERGLAEARRQAFVGKTNSYTGEAITDEVGAQIYQSMQEIEARGGDPLSDYHAYVAAQLRNEHTRRQEEEKSVTTRRQEVAEFAKQHPGVKLDELIKTDAKFVKFAKGKIGTMPIGQIYNDYAELTGALDAQAQTAARNIVAKQKASPGSLAGNPSKALSAIEEELIFERLLKG